MLGNANIEVVQARHGEPGIFSHVRSGKGRCKVDATLIVHTRAGVKLRRRAIENVWGFHTLPDKHHCNL